MSIVEPRRLLALCGVFMIGCNATKHFLWDSLHDLANPRIQERAIDPITLSLIDSKKAGSCIEVQEDTTYQSSKSAQSNHHDKHAMWSLNRELHDAGAELRLNSINLSPVLGNSIHVSKLASALHLPCYPGSDRPPASLLSSDPVWCVSRKRIRENHEVSHNYRWPSVNVQPDDPPDFSQSPPIKLTKTNKDSSSLENSAQADKNLPTTVDFLRNFGKCSDPEEASWITHTVRSDQPGPSRRRVARFRYRKDVSRYPDDDCNQDRKLFGHSLVETPVAKKQNILEPPVEVDTTNGFQNQLEHTKIGYTLEEGSSPQHSSSLNTSNERNLVGINSMILESGMIQNCDPDIYKEIGCKKNTELSDHIELPMESLVFDESAFGVDTPKDQKKLEQVLKIIRSSELVGSKKTLKLRFEDALDQFSNFKYASSQVIQADQNEAPLSTDWRYPLSKRGSMQIKCNELWKSRLLWLKFWQQITQIDLHSENLKYFKCPVIEKVFPLFLFYVDMIDTIIIDSSKPKHKTNPQSSSDQLKRKKTGLFKVAVKRFEEFSKMRSTSKNAHSGLMKLDYGKSRKYQPHVQQLLWDFLEYWIKTSGRVDLIELYSRGYKPNNQSFKGFFNTIYKLSIVQFNKQLRDSLKLH